MNRAAVATVSTLLALATAAPAQPLPKGERERACWLQHTRERTRVRLNEPTSVDFANLRNGYTVRSPFVVDFAVRGMGVIPAGKPHARAGHHHLLIDTPLPRSIGEPIPFNDGHRHFGKAQTSANVELPPGRHRLRLLFADHAHKPYFVYSPEITVTVSGPRGVAPLAIDAGCELWYQEELSRPRAAGARVLVSNLRDGEPVVSPLNVRLAADGFGIAPRGSGVPETGHFVLEVLQAGRLAQTVDLANGATQANLFLAPAAYTLRLHLYDDTRSRELVPAAEIGIAVTAQERI
jgi:hypothetical protein